LGLKRTRIEGSEKYYITGRLMISSPNIFREIKSRIMIWTWYVARMVERRGAYRVFDGET
jgi:hypothetical protein